MKNGVFIAKMDARNQFSILKNPTLDTYDDYIMNFQNFPTVVRIKNGRGHYAIFAGFLGLPSE